MMKQVTIKEFVKELNERIEKQEDINCCKEEIKTFANYVSDKIGDETIEIEWKD